MIVSLNPTYHCNFRCKFCYLTPDQLSDKRHASLDIVVQRLREVNNHKQITHVDFYGGEVQLLSEEYVSDILSAVTAVGVESISLITNLSIVRNFVLDERINLTVSYDFGARQDHEKVFNNMLCLDRSFSVLTLASRDFLDTVSVDEFVRTFNMLPNMESVEIKPYSKNQANDQGVLNVEFEDYVWAVLTHPERMFNFQNEMNIDEVVHGERNSFSDDHVYITPAGKFAVLEFDEGDREFFLELDSISDYLDWAAKEKIRVVDNKICGSCKYLGHCLSEHLRDVKDDGDSCNGFKGLILKWVEEDE